MGISGPDFVRTHEDPVTFLRLRALVLAPKLGVPIDVMDRLIGIVISALGADWLNEVAEDVPGAVPLPIPRHYVGHLVATAGESQIGELLELGQYLESLYSVDGFASALVSLRSAYHQTLLQLAMTTRFQLCGAQIVRLEPPATDGRLADIELMFEAVRYQVECYRPTFKGTNEQTYELVRFEQAVLDYTKGCSRPYAIAVAFSEAPTPQLRKETAAVIGRSIREMEADAGSGDGRVPAILIRGPGAVVSLVPTIATPPGTPPFLPRHPDFPHQGDDHVSYMRVGSVPRREAAGVHASAELGVGTSCVGVCEVLPRT